MTRPELTEGGLAYVVQNANRSILAKVALAVHFREADEWPMTFQRLAVATCNEAGRAFER